MNDQGVPGRTCSCAHPIVEREPAEAASCAKCGHWLELPYVSNDLPPRNGFGAPPADRRPEPAAPRAERDATPTPAAIPRSVPALGQAGSGPSFDWPFAPAGKASGRGIRGRAR